MANEASETVTGTAQAERVAAQETIAQRMAGYESAGVPNPSRPLGETVEVAAETDEEPAPTRTTIVTHKKTTASKPTLVASAPTVATPTATAPNGTATPKPIKDGE